MKTGWIISLALVGLAASLPLVDQRALANSLQVGRPGDPNAWNCFDCNDMNRPRISYRVESEAHGIVSIISLYDDEAVLAFRYTANTKNVRQDLMFAAQVQDEHTCPSCKIQRQYNSMWEKIKLSVLSELAKMEISRLAISGISLGGGLACVSFVDILHAQLFSSIQVITFGAPRVGNRAWADWFDQHAKLKRFVIRDDPIAYLPKSVPGVCNYKQTGAAIQCNPQTSVCSELAPESDVYEGSVGMIVSALLQVASYDFNRADYGSIVDHVFGYKKIANYTLLIRNE